MGGSDGSGTSAPRGSRRVQAVDHAIDILEAIGQAGRPVGVSAIARKTGLSKTSVHHLIATLASRRFVMREEDQPAFRLSWGLYELGASVVRDLDLAQAARPQLDWCPLRRASRPCSALDDDAVLYLDRGGSPSDVHMVANAGRAHRSMHRPAARSCSHSWRIGHPRPPHAADGVHALDDHGYRRPARRHRAGTAPRVRHRAAGVRGRARLDRGARARLHWPVRRLPGRGRTR